jgi:hypothetical protein
MADQNQSSVLNPSSIDNPGTSTSSPGASQGSSQAGGPQLNSQGQRQQGTGFTNLSKYLQAGQGTGGSNSAGGQLGNAINQGVSNQANQFNQNLGTSQNQFNTNVSQNSLGNYNDPTNQNSANVKSTINGLLNPSGGTTSQPNTATSGQFQNYLSGNYAGPTSLGNTQQLGLQSNNLQQLGQSTQSAGGIGGLLQQFAGGQNKQYNQGEQGLDSLLVGQQGQAGLNAANRTANQTSQQYNAALQNASQTANQAALQNKNFATSTLGALQGAVNPIDTSLQQASIAQNTANQASIAPISTLAANIGEVLAKQGITSTSTPQQQAAGLQSLINQGFINSSNIGQLDIGNDYAGNINLNNLQAALQNQTAPTTTPGGVMSANQAAQLQALQSLAGGNNILPQDISQAQIQAAQNPNATTSTPFNGFQNAFNTAGVINNGTGAINQSQIANTAASNASTLAGYQKNAQILQNQIDAINNGATNPDTGSLSPGDNLANLQQQLGNYNTDITNLQASTANQPQFQTIQQMLAAGNGGTPSPKQNAGSGSSTTGGAFGVGTGSRIG